MRKATRVGALWTYTAIACPSVFRVDEKTAIQALNRRAHAVHRRRDAR